jgi:integrase/recombinase XerD
MDKQNIEYFNADTMRGFQTYYQTSHESPEGRWEMGHLNARYYKNVSSGTAAEYHRHIHTLCRWLVAQGFVKRSPIEGVTRPVHRPSRNFRVFTKEECKNLLKAAVKTDYAERDLAIITLLLETGLRATELCTLRWCDIDMEQRKAVVMGKGEKTRTVYWFRDVQTILMQWATYAHYTDLDPSTYVFPSERAEHLNKDSLRKIVKRIALIAQIRDCHPHAFRHTFAVMYLLSGGQQMALKQLMGHEKLEMTDKYVRFAEVDIAEAARKHSPMEYIKKKK